MATAEQVSEFRQTNQAIVNLALQQLTTFLATAPSEKDLSEFWVEFVSTFGRIAATTAADWYDELRADSSAAIGYTATVADPAPAEQALGVLKWARAPQVVHDQVPLSDAEIRARLDAGETVAAAHDVKPRYVAATPEQVAAKLSRSTQRLILQAGRDTIVRSVAGDPAKARYARVPSGAETCAFCLMLASRGAVYESRESASKVAQGTGKRKSGDKYHDLCDCTPTPMWSDSAYPDGYDPDGLYQQYINARDAVGDHFDTPAILSVLRQQQDIN